MNNINLNFGRALTTQEKKEYIQTVDKARELLGVKNTLLIAPDIAMPQDIPNNTGVGNLSSNESLNYAKFMRNMLRINSIEVLPQGKIRLKNNNFYGPYSGSGFALGEHTVNLNLLTTKEYGKILSRNNIDSIVLSNDRLDKQNRINYENVIGEIGTISNQRVALKNAFNNFVLSKNNSLKNEFENYKNDNAGWLDNFALYQALGIENNNPHWQNWNNTDKYLIKNKNSEVSKNRINEIESKYKDEIEFNKFCQFIADKQLSDSKNELNSQGIKLWGDCLIGFSNQEVWANMDAFLRGDNIASNEWGLPVINYNKIYKKDGSLDSAGELLKHKFEIFFKRYDAVRFDVAWSYIQPVVKINGNSERTFYGDGIIKLIYKTAEDVQGNKYNKDNISLEVESGDFSAFDYNNDNVKCIPALKGKTKIFTTEYKHDNWGSVSFLKKAGLSADEYTIGVGNHDNISLRELAENYNQDEKRSKQYNSLSKDLKIDKESLTDPKNFISAKFAELFTAKNQFLTFWDVLGIKQSFDNTGVPQDDYRTKIPSSFEKEYFTKLHQGLGLNLPESLILAMKAKNINEQGVINQLNKFADILKQDGSMTEKAANIKYQPENSSEQINKKGFLSRLFSPIISLFKHLLHLFD